MGGRAILQTMTPQNQTIRFAAEQNYDAFFEAELPLRQLRGCPPYRDLLTVTFHGREEERVWQAALAFRARLDGLLHSGILPRGDRCRAWPGPGLRCADQLSLSLPPDA